MRVPFASPFIVMRRLWCLCLVSLLTVLLATQDYSGADLRLLCKEAAMRPVRRLMATLDALPPPPEQRPARDGMGRRQAVSDADVQVRDFKEKVEKVKRITQIEVATSAWAPFTPCLHCFLGSQTAILSDPINAEDLAGALANTRRSAHFKADKYRAWEREFGAT
jgi:hypothetical protein